MIEQIVSWINARINLKAYGVATLSKGNYPEIDQEPLKLEQECLFHVQGVTNVNITESEFLAAI